MPTIFVDTDNSNIKAKLYDGSKAGHAAAKAEAKIQSVVKGLVDKAAGFTTTKTDGAKGYIVRIGITKIERPGHETTCWLEGTIARYPRTASVKRKDGGEEFITLGTWGNHATASGTSEGSIIDCVEAVTESMMKSGIPAMSRDFLKR